MKSILLVGIGGAIGSIFRYLISVSTNKIWNNSFPLGTFVINIIGCLIIGIIVSLAQKQNIIDNNLKLLLITGFCGGFTTFSTFSLENIQLLNSGNIIAFILNILLSVSVGILGVWVGLNLIK